jgi:hypothetical protein
MLAHETDDPSPSSFRQLSEDQKLRGRRRPGPHRNGANRTASSVREVGVHPYRVLGAEDGHGGAEPDPFGPTGDRGEDHVTRRIHEFGAVVLADVEGVDSDGVGEDRLLDGVRITWSPADWLPVLVDGQRNERVEAKFEFVRRRVVLSAPSRVANRALGR